MGAKKAGWRHTPSCGVLLILYVCSLTVCSWAQTGYNARSLGMAGAYSGLARGADACRWNPANLGLPDNPRASLDFLGLGFGLGNNSLSLSQYNNYFSRDYFNANGAWDAAAKEEILSFIPERGFRGFDRLQLTAVAGSYGRYALAVNSFLNSDIRLPYNIFAVPLVGLDLEAAPLEGVSGQAIAGTEIAFSAAQEFQLGGDKIQHFSAGGTLKYYIGHFFARIAQADGMMLSNQDSIVVEGQYRVQQSGWLMDGGDVGSGLGLDLGAAAQINDKLEVGLALTNILGFIHFEKYEERQRSFSFRQPGLNIDEFDNFSAYMDSVTTTFDTTFVSESGLNYSLPRSFTLSSVYRLQPGVLVELDYQQGLNRTAGGTTTPRFALGGEMRRYRFLPVRLGLSAGGVQGVMLAFGIGLDFAHYQLDFATANQNGLFNHSRGLHYALSQRIIF